MQIITNGFKGKDIRIRIPKLTLLIGPNGCGKSTVSDAIRFAVLGHVPTLGKRPSDTAALMRQDVTKMEVQIIFDGGGAFRRTIERHGKKFTSVGQVDHLMSKSAKEHDAEILKYFGNEELDVSECLDIRELLAATANQRAARIEQLLMAGMKSPQKKAERVAELVARRLANKEDLTLDDWKDLLPIIPTHQRDVLAEHGAMLTGKILELGLAQAISWANGEKRTSMRDLKTKTEAKKELDTIVENLSDVDPKIVAENRTERDTLNKELGIGQERAERVQEWNERKSRLDERKATSTKASEEAAAARKEWEGRRGNIKPLEEHRDKTKKELEDLKLPQPSDGSKLETLRLALEAAEKERDALDLPQKKDRANLRSMNAEVDKIANEIAQSPSATTSMPNIDLLKSEVDQAEKATKDREKSPWGEVQNKIAPTIRKATGKEQGKNLETIRTAAGRLEILARENMGNLDDLEYEQRSAVQSLKNGEAERDEKIAANNKIIKKRKALQAKWEEGRDKLKEARDAIHEEELSELDEYDKELNRFTEAMKEKRKERNALAEELSAKDEKLQDAYSKKKRELEKSFANMHEQITGWHADELRTVTAVGNASTEAVDVDAAIRELGTRPEPGPKSEDLKTRLDELNKTLDRMERALGTKNELTRLIEWIEGLEAVTAVFAAFEWALKFARNEEINEAGGPLVAEMSTFLTATKRKETPYFRADQGLCEIGWATPDGLEVPIQALSGGEWVLFAAALTAAVINLRGAPKRVLLVEAAETDPEMMQSLLAGISAVSENLTAAIVMTCHPVTNEGWAIRRPGEEVEEPETEKEAEEAPATA